VLITEDPPNESLPNHGDLPIAHREIKNANVIAEEEKPLRFLKGP